MLSALAVVLFLMSILAVFGGSYFVLMSLAETFRDFPYVTLVIGVASLVIALAYSKGCVTLAGSLRQHRR